MTTIKTMRGKELNLNDIELKNETVRAIGNMNVNARGDEIDHRNNTVATRTRRAGRNYQEQIATSNVQDVPVPNNQVQQEQVQQNSDEVIISAIAGNTTEAAPKTKPKAKAKGGLASAIAKAKETKSKAE